MKYKTVIAHHFRQYLRYWYNDPLKVEISQHLPYGEWLL